MNKPQRFSRLIAHTGAVMFPVVALTAALFSGCATDQDADIKAYRDIVDLPAPLSASAALSDGQLTLWEAMELANQQNERLSIEGENFLQAIIARRKTFTSLLPGVDLAPTYFRGENVTGTGANSANSRTDVPFKATLNLNILQELAALDRDALTIEQRRFLLLDQQEALLVDVATAYFAVLRADAAVAVLNGSTAAQTERARLVRGRRDVGLGRELDVAQIEAQLAQTRVALLDAQTFATTARATLEFLINAKLGDAKLGAGRPAVPATDVDNAATPAWLARAAASRQDLLAVRAEAEAARKDVDVAWSQYFPSISLNLEAFLSRDSFPQDRDWEGVVGINIPIFSAGRIEADVRRAWSRARQTDLRASLLGRQINRDIEIACAELSAAKTRAKELELQSASAHEAQRLAEASLAAGLATNLERVQAQADVLAADRALSDAKLDAALRELSLKRAAGGLRAELEQHRPSIATTANATN